METRRNLVRELQDHEYRKKYLHPKTRTKWETFKKLFTPIFKEKNISLYYLVFAITQGLIPILGAFIVQQITKIVENILKTKTEIHLEAIMPLIYVVIGYTILTILFISVGKYILSKLHPFYFAKRNTLLLNNFKKFTTMEYGLYEDSTFQDAIGFWSRALESNMTGYQGILTKSITLAGDFVGLALLFILLSTVSIQIVIIAIISMIAYTLIEIKLSEFQRSKLEEDQKITRPLNTLKDICADFKYGKDVRVFEMQDAFKSLFNKLIKERDDFLYSLFKYRLKFQLPSAIALSITFLAGLYFLGLGYMNNDIDGPKFLMMIMALTLAINISTKFSQDLAFVFGEFIYLEDFYDWIDADVNPSGGMNCPEEIDCTIKFEDVWFRYPGSEEWVLQNVNFTIPNKSSLALVGVNGAGKTTIIKLLTGLYQAEKGRITIGGIDISRINPTELSKIFGVVFQEINPVAMTIAENISASSGEIDEDKIRNVLNQVGLLEKIESYPLGIHTPLLRTLEEDGIILSGGENQKLMIARALYKDTSKILILDEPTAALDAIAEEEIYKSFNELLQGRTAIFISHRLASTRFCNKIALLNGGKMEEEGTHEELLKRGELYCKMYETQASYYREGENHEKW